MPLTFKEVQEIINDIHYRDWRFKLMEKGDGFLVQALFDATDIKTGEPAQQKSRKWYVSSHACVSEVVRTIYKCIECAESHERDESFEYQGALVFNPHLDVQELASRLRCGYIVEDTRNGNSRNL